MEGLKCIAAVAFVLSQMVVCYAMPNPVQAVMPANCTNQNYCFDMPPNYPQKLINSLLADTEDLFEEHEELIGHRFGEETPPNECEPILRIDPIYQIVDENGNTRFVVQSEKRFMQVVRVEKCAEPGFITRKTRNLSLELVQMYKLKCVEKTLDFKFVVLSLDGQSMEAVKVKDGLPVCCSCQTDDKLNSDLV